MRVKLWSVFPQNNLARNAFPEFAANEQKCRSAAQNTLKAALLFGTAARRHGDARMARAS